MKQVHRKAEIGEYIKIIDNTAESYKAGDVFFINGKYDIHPSTSDVKMTDGDDMFFYDWEYDVLEDYKPEDNKPNVSLSSLTEKVNEIKTMLSNIQKEISEVKSLIADVESLPTCESKSNEMEEFTLPFPDGLSSNKEVTRFEVIGFAIKDVLGLLRTNHSNVHYIEPEFSAWRYAQLRDEVRFVVNEKKRTVVALVYTGDIMFARGVAHCMKEDVFNSDIGKAIALRKAFNLPLPNYYVKDLPQPEEIYEGNVVEIMSGRNKGKYAKVTKVDSYTNTVFVVTEDNKRVGGHKFAFKLVNDSKSIS